MGAVVARVQGSDPTRTVEGDSFVGFPRLNES